MGDLIGPTHEITVIETGVRVHFPVARGAATVWAYFDGRLHVFLDVRVYGRDVRGLVVLGGADPGGAFVQENRAEVVDPERGRLSGRQQATCGRLAITYARQSRRVIRAAVDELRAADRKLHTIGL
jgi:hypothetical protein